MMWVVYNTETAHIYGKFYLKPQAKNFIKHNLPWSGKGNMSRVTADKVDMMKYDEWEMWVVLKSKSGI